MKPALNLAYIISSVSLGDIKIENAIAIGSIYTAENLSKPTVSQQLLSALGRINTSSAVFSTLNMASPLIKSLNLDLLFRNYENPLDIFKIDATQLDFSVKKFLEDVPEVSDIAGKFLTKPGTVDLVRVLDEARATKTQFRIFGEAAGASAELKPFYIGKRAESVLTFNETILIDWRSKLIFIEEPLLLDTASLLYEKNTADSNVSTFVVAQVIRATNVKDTLGVLDSEEKDLNLSFTNFLTPYLNHVSLDKSFTNYISSIPAGTGSITERDTELATIDSARWSNNEFPGTGIAFNTGKRLNNAIELEELPELYRVISALETTDFEELTKKLTKINISAFKRPFQQIHNGTLTNFVTTSVSNYNPRRLEGQGPFTDRDIELATINSARWSNNEFPGIGIVFDKNKKLNTVIELEDTVFPVKAINSLDITAFEEVAAKKLEASFVTPKGLNSFAGRDTELATINSARWSNNEFPGIGIVFDKNKKLSTSIDLEDIVFHVKVKNLNETILNEDSKKLFQTLDFLSNIGTETERDTELLSIYAGRDGMSFQLPLHIDVEQLSIRTNYVLPTKIVGRTSVASTEENIEDLFVYKNILNKAELEDKAGKAVAKNKLLENISTNVQVLPVKVIPIDRDLFSVIESIEDKLILKNVLQDRKILTHSQYVLGSGWAYTYIEQYTPFRVELEDTSVLDSIKGLIESTSVISLAQAARQTFGFDEFNIVDTSKKEVQKVLTEEPLLLDTLYRQVEYKRDHQAENAFADDTLSAFSQNYSSGYFSQAYVGIEITGD